MANVQNKFVDPAGNYTGGYVSETLQPNVSSHISNQTRGVMQVDIISGEVTVFMKVHFDANWIPVRVYTQSGIEEIVLGNYIKVEATDSAKAWLGQVK